MHNQVYNSQSFGIERIQDIDNDSDVTQVKFRASQKYSSAKLREPTLQLIKEYQQCPDKNYTLYCHFKDQKPKKWQPFEEDLDRIITTRKESGQSVEIEESTKRDFLRNFTIIFAPEFGDQYNQILSLLKKERGDSTDEELAFYYSQSFYYLNRIVTTNSDQKKRTCSKKELLDFIKNRQYDIFLASFRHYLGTEKYYNFIKKRFPKPEKNHINYIFLGEISEDPSTSISDLIEGIVKNYYLKAQIDINPLVFIADCKKYQDLKRALLRKDIYFNDGYEEIEFTPNAFIRDPIKRKKVSGRKANDSLDNISFKIRIIHTDNIPKLSGKLKPDKIYRLDSSAPKEYHDIPLLEIHGLDSQRLLKLFTS